MKKNRQEKMVNALADACSKSPHILHYIFVYELDDGSISRVSCGSQMALLGLLETFKIRITDEYRNYAEVDNDDNNDYD
jgi:hypothetical protein